MVSRRQSAASRVHHNGAVLRSRERQISDEIKCFGYQADPLWLDDSRRSEANFGYVADMLTMCASVVVGI